MLASASRVCVRSVPFEDSDTGGCELCGKKNCRRRVATIKVTLDGYSRRTECDELDITSKMMAGSHCGERLLRVAHLYWMLNQAHAQRAAAPIAYRRAMFKCVRYALGWAKAAERDTGRRDFKPQKFTAGPHASPLWVKK